MLEKMGVFMDGEPVDKAIYQLEHASSNHSSGGG
jgi:hypothetical protein